MRCARSNLYIDLKIATPPAAARNDKFIILDQAAPPRKMNRLDAAIRAEFGEDIAYVEGRRPLSDAEAGGDLFVAQAFGHQLQDFFFTQRQRRHGQ